MPLKLFQTISDIIAVQFKVFPSKFNSSQVKQYLTNDIRLMILEN